MIEGVKNAWKINEAWSTFNTFIIYLDITALLSVNILLLLRAGNKGLQKIMNKKYKYKYFTNVFNVSPLTININE